MTDFEPVVIVNHGIFLLLVRKELPVSTLAEFIAYAKVNQKKMQFGSAGAGGINQMACVLLTIAMGTNITQVPYRGNALALQDLIGGRITLCATPCYRATADSAKHGEAIANPDAQPREQAVM